MPGPGHDPQMISIDSAIDMVLAAVKPVAGERVDLLAALGRTLCAPLDADEDVPSFDNSAMDGYALRGGDIAAPPTALTVVAEIPAGRSVTTPVGAGEAAKIMTGAPLPPGADTVVPVEQTRQDGATVTILETVAPGANVRAAAEDIARGDRIIESGTVLGPAEIGLLASVGFVDVPVARRPRVAVLATGSELVPPGQPLGPGQIRNSNSFTAYGQVLAAGGEPVLLGIARDDLGETRELIARALEEDVAITSGGVSVGEFDFVRQVQDELGVARGFWRVAVKPGKPVAFGTHGDTLVFGVPGNPVAAMVSFELYIRPVLLAMQGRRDIYRPCVLAAAAGPVKRAKDRTEARRCRVVRRAGEIEFTTTGPQGSGILRSMALADGLAFVPPGYPGGEIGERLMVMLLEGSSADRPPFPA
jgi:molybdopterin molybdotransferase